MVSFEFVENMYRRGIEDPVTCYQRIGMITLQMMSILKRPMSSTILIDLCFAYEYVESRQSKRCDKTHKSTVEWVWVLAQVPH